MGKNCLYFSACRVGCATEAQSHPGGRASTFGACFMAAGKAQLQLCWLLPPQNEQNFPPCLDIIKQSHKDLD